MPQAARWAPAQELGRGEAVDPLERAERLLSQQRRLIIGQAAAWPADPPQAEAPPRPGRLAEPREDVAAARRAASSAGNVAPPRLEGHEDVQPASAADGAVVLRRLDVLDAQVDARVRGLEARVASCGRKAEQEDWQRQLRELEERVQCTLQQEDWERQFRELEERVQCSLLRVDRAEHTIGCHGRSLEQSAAMLQVHAERLQSAENARESAPPWYAQLESAMAGLERRAEEGRAGVEVEQQRLRLALESVRRRSGEALLGLRGEMETKLKAELGHLAARLEEGLAEVSMGPPGGGASWPPVPRHTPGGHELSQRLDDAEARLASLRERVEAQDGRLTEVTERLEKARRVERLQREEADLEADCQQQFLQQRVATLDDLVGQLTPSRTQEGPQYAEKAWVERQLSELYASLDDGLGRLREGPQYEQKTLARAALRASLGDGMGRLGLGRPQEGPQYAEKAWAERQLSELKASLDDGLGPLQQVSELRASVDSCAKRVEELASCALNGDSQGCHCQMLEIKASVADQAQQIKTLTQEFTDAIACMERTLQGVAEKAESRGDRCGLLEALTEKASSLEDAMGVVKATDALERRLLELEGARVSPAAEASGYAASLVGHTEAVGSGLATVYNELATEQREGMALTSRDDSAEDACRTVQASHREVVSRLQVSEAASKEKEVRGLPRPAWAPSANVAILEEAVKALSREVESELVALREQKLELRRAKDLSATCRGPEPRRAMGGNAGGSDELEASADSVVDLPSGLRRFGDQVVQLAKMAAV